MKKSIIAISLASLVLVACSKTENKQVEEQTLATTEAVSEATVADTAHTAENALDWNGTYKGQIKLMRLKKRILVKVMANHLKARVVSNSIAKIHLLLN